MVRLEYLFYIKLDKTRFVSNLLMFYFYTGILDEIK